jgi:hypothetical protein
LELAPTYKNQVTRHQQKKSGTERDFHKENNHPKQKNQAMVSENRQDYKKQSSFIKNTQYSRDQVDSRDVTDGQSPIYKEIFFEYQDEPGKKRNPNAPEYVTVKLDITKDIPQTRYIKSQKTRYRYVSDEKRWRRYMEDHERRKKERQQNSPNMNLQQKYYFEQMAKESQESQNHDNFGRRNQDSYQEEDVETQLVIPPKKRGRPPKANNQKAEQKNTEQNMFKAKNSVPFGPRPQTQDLNLRPNQGTALVGKQKFKNNSSQDPRASNSFFGQKGQPTAGPRRPQ